MAERIRASLRRANQQLLDEVRIGSRSAPHEAGTSAALNFLLNEYRRLLAGDLAVEEARQNLDRRARRVSELRREQSHD